MCAPHIGEASSSGSCESEEESDCEDIAREAADAAKAKAEEESMRLRNAPDSTLAALRAQKREAIRKAVEAQRAELDGGRK